MPIEALQNDHSGDERSRLLRISAVLGLIGVALGAFGAHGLEKMIEDPKRLATWDTAVFYHLTHAVMLYLIAVGGRLRRAAWICMALGVLIFSGSLYVLVLSGIGWLGAITPVGGVFFLVGWGLLIARPAR
ncbi:MAG: uncharacterized membrane protein YgdD (TMEM256/DUF423 family) [Verrucomicrobiales bacterium]|jgi:uncharacterized membrane protein YgdD (TMEM256/DUF423 family)